MSFGNRKLFLLLSVSVCFQLIFYFYVKTLQCDCNYVAVELEKTLQENFELTVKFNNLQRTFVERKRRSHSLEKLLNLTIHKVQRKKSSFNDKNKTPKPHQPRKNTKAFDKKLFSSLVTIILYSKKGNSQECLFHREKLLKKKYPEITVLTANISLGKTVGYQFNSLIWKVKTKYFFFLYCRHLFMDHKSDHGPGWLLDAMENVPELDFVSGSILNRDKLEIPCYRLKTCNWTFSQSYEYKKSIAELMLCEDIGTSFIGRTSTIYTKFRDKLIFDQELTTLATTDFFLYAKKLGVVCGVRPEVMLHVCGKDFCRVESQSVLQEYRSLLPFAHKHKVFKFKRSDTKELDLCGGDSPMLGKDICDEETAHKIMLNGSHWSKEGTFAYPFILRNIQSCLFKVTDFLTSRKIPFIVNGGVALGAVKFRGILPWDAGDADLEVYGRDVFEVYDVMQKYALKHNFTVHRKGSIELVQVYCTDETLSKKIGGLVSLDASNYDKNPGKFIKLRVNGRWLPFSENIFRDLRKDYDVDFLKHKFYESEELIYCKKRGHSSCLPDFRSRGDKKDGTYKEHFCNK